MYRSRRVKPRGLCRAALLVASILAVVGVVAVQSNAAKVTFTATNSNSWENPGNWSNGTVPTVNDDVTIPRGQTATMSEATTKSVKSLTVNGKIEGQIIAIQTAAAGSSVTNNGTIGGAGTSNVELRANGNIKNKGKIQGGDCSASGTPTHAAADPPVPNSAGGSIRVSSSNRVTNTGTIKGGDCDKKPNGVGGDAAIDAKEIVNKGVITGGKGNKANGFGGCVYATAEEFICGGRRGLSGGSGAQKGRARADAPVIWNVSTGGYVPYLLEQTGFCTQAIDPSEIDGAVTFDDLTDAALQIIDVRFVGGGFSYPVTVFLKQDGASQYWGIEIEDLPYESLEEVVAAGGHEVFAGFDVGEDGQQWTAGDDLVLYNLREGIATDCCYPSDYYFVSDEDLGGANDVVGAAAFANGTLTVEFLRPLNSGDIVGMDPLLDSGDEIAVRLGLTFSFEMLMEEDLIITVE